MRAYERLIKYAQIETTSTEESGLHPSFEGEFVLANILADELKELGLENVKVTDKCYVYGVLRATSGYEDITPYGFIAHMDTSPDASGKNVKPILHENYDGSDVTLPGSGEVMEVIRFPFLSKFKGETLITSDGTTLLGADDKAGVAEIMTALERLKEEKIPHGELWIAFTPDEEIGEGADFFDIEGFGAKYAYTVDGGDVDTIEYENFNASSAHVDVTGFSVHPGDAKNIMKNAGNIAMEFHALLPEKMRPEHTSGREGFMHLVGMSGSTSSATLDYIVRDHDLDKLRAMENMMRKAEKTINAKYGDGTLKLSLEDSYFNMLEKIKPHMHLIDRAKAAISAAGYSPLEIPIRGGTDGARLSYEGLPCPNLGTGGYNFHGNFECITAERMDSAVSVILHIAEHVCLGDFD